jgi:hypothetical protein
VRLELLDRLHAGLDALGERHLVLAGEERDAPDLLQVHAHVVRRQRRAAIVIARRT